MIWVLGLGPNAAQRAKSVTQKRERSSRPACFAVAHCVGAGNGNRCRDLISLSETD